VYLAMRNRAAAIGDLIQAYKDLGAQSDAYTKDHLKAQTLAWYTLQGTSAAYITAISKLPKSVQTAISLDNVKPTQAQIIDLAAKYNATPKSVQTLLATLGYADSLSKVEHLIAVAKQLDHQRTIRIDADTSAAIAAFQSLSRTWRNIFSGLGMTDTVINPKTHKSTTATARVPIIGKLFAGGGLVTGPGSGTSDSIPARLSNGEFIVNAAAASRHRALLEAINNPGLINLPRGSQVIPNGRSQQMAGVGMRSGSASSGSVHLSDQSIAKLARAIVSHSSSAVLNELEFAGGY
jgi:hypothetical protein